MLSTAACTDKARIGASQAEMSIAWMFPASRGLLATPLIQPLQQLQQTSTPQDCLLSVKLDQQTTQHPHQYYDDVLAHTECFHTSVHMQLQLCSKASFPAAPSCVQVPQLMMLTSQRRPEVAASRMNWDVPGHYIELISTCILSLKWHCKQPACSTHVSILTASNCWHRMRKLGSRQANAGW